MRSPLIAALVGALVLASACGSTAELDGASVSASDERSLGSDDGMLSTPEAGVPGMSPAAPVAGRGSGRVAGTPGAASGAPSSEGATASTASPAPVADGPIQVGMMYSSDTNAYVESVGADAAQADARRTGQAVIDHINANGGVAGRPLEPVWYNASATESPQAMSQGACTAWTQDNHVLVALPENPLQDVDLTRTCLTKANVVGIYLNSYARTLDRQYDESPMWFELETLSLETAARTYVAGLDEQGFFHDAKVGVVYDEGPSFVATAETVLLPALRAAGADVVATATSNVRGTGDIASANAQISNAVLRFRSEGVTHVLFFEPWVGWILFAQNANSQGWQPTYGLSTQSLLQVAVETGLVPTNQLAGAKAVGWNPGVDVPIRDSGTWARKELCLEIFTDAGVEGELEASQDAYMKSMSQCAGLLLLADAGRSISGPISTADLVAAIEAMSDVPLANAPRARFAPDRHYGGADWRPVSFDGGCTCFRYTGAATPI